MEKTVLTQEEIKQLTSLQEQQNNFVIRLGEIEYQKNLLNQQKEQIKGEIKAFEANQIKLAQEFEGKYGKGSVNIDTGEFIKA
tara:strand:+ start:297 stop:545 length:249 start_codon:yes stop_codon:yes gene_type:complete